MSFDPLLVIIILAVIGVPAIFLLAEKRKPLRNGITYLPRSAQYEPDDDPLDEYPYQLQHDFLTPTERNYFHNLRNVVGSRTFICPKVRLGDVFWVKLDDRS